MNLLKLALPLLLVTAACKKDDNETDAPMCPVTGTIAVPVTVVNVDNEPIDAMVEIRTTNPANPDGADPNQFAFVTEPCAGGAGAYTCNAIVGDEVNVVTAEAFPDYQPGSVQVNVNGPDCESATGEIRLMPGTK